MGYFHGNEYALLRSECERLGEGKGLEGEGGEAFGQQQLNVLGGDEALVGEGGVENQRFTLGQRFGLDARGYVQFHDRNGNAGLVVDGSDNLILVLDGGLLDFPVYGDGVEAEVDGHAGAGAGVNEDVVAVGGVGGCGYADGVIALGQFNREKSVGVGCAGGYGCAGGGMRHGY